MDMAITLALSLESLPLQACIEPYTPNDEIA